ncbi:MAG: AbrB/MazE/SpoVT family DNA-binding domain-containing protein [Coriobacteriia bacterium]|nr:AbrB/MazE/SpoVT family DNA-binding domain-containing protein [Coriobacteriia bacterium]
MGAPVMDLSTMTRNCQVTVPVEFRRLLGIEPGNKVLFITRPNGDVVIGNATVAAMRKAQAVFAGAAASFDYQNEDDVTADIMASRYGSDALCE